MQITPRAAIFETVFVQRLYNRSSQLIRTQDPFLGKGSRGLELRVMGPRILVW